MKTPLGGTWAERGILAFAGAVGTVLLTAAPAAALPLISEVFYDAVGSDTGQSFVELYGAPGTDLTGFTVEGVNGSNGAVTDSVALVGLIPADGIFVLASDLGDGTTLVENPDLIELFDFQLHAGIATEKKNTRKRTARRLFRTMRTLRFEWIHLPARVSRPMGRTQLRIAAEPRTRNRIDQALQRLAA